MSEPTEQQKEELWRLCGVKKDRVYEQGAGYISVYPDITLKNLIISVLPRVSNKAEFRFRVGFPNTDMIRCELSPHLPGGIQHYECDRQFIDTPAEEDYAIPLFWLVRRALLDRMVGPD